MKRFSFALMVLLTLLPLSACTNREEELPPQNARPLSELIKTVEQRQDFQAITEIDFDEGVYEIDYVTKDGAKREVKIDPVSGTEK